MPVCPTWWPSHQAAVAIYLLEFVNPPTSRAAAEDDERPNATHAGKPSASPAGRSWNSAAPLPPSQSLLYQRLDVTTTPQLPFGYYGMFWWPCCLRCSVDSCDDRQKPPVSPLILRTLEVQTSSAFSFVPRMDGFSSEAFPHPRMAARQAPCPIRGLVPSRPVQQGQAGLEPHEFVRASRLRCVSKGR